MVWDAVERISTQARACCMSFMRYLFSFHFLRISSHRLLLPKNYIRHVCYFFATSKKNLKVHCSLFAVWFSDQFLLEYTNPYVIKLEVILSTDHRFSTRLIFQTRRNMKEEKINFLVRTNLIESSGGGSWLIYTKSKLI